MWITSDFAVSAEALLATIFQCHIGTTGKRTKIGVPARLINDPGLVWQGKVSRHLGIRIQDKDIVRPSRLSPLLIVRGLVQTLLDQFTLPYFADSFAQTSPMCRYLDTEKEIGGRCARTIKDDMGELGFCIQSSVISGFDIVG